ncbi:MAG: winged helix-turn-helix transcriptional regulator [Limnohabitans sp.]|jgi:DNA-binding MarR family transcriptional regulator|nr:winged helix-turn-helix transcriptional regulator [Limnohabitans sp.]
MTTKNAYLRFLNLLRGVEASLLPPTLDSTAKALLERIACQHALGNPLTITEAMALGEVASPATIHRKIDDLRVAGLVDTEFQGDNRRTKYLTPTPRARKYFDKVNALLPRAQATS